MYPECKNCLQVHPHIVEYSLLHLLHPNGFHNEVNLRAERYDPAGRTYDLNVAATDIAGNVAKGSATCLVPHDKGH